MQRAASSGGLHAAATGMYHPQQMHYLPAMPAGPFLYNNIIMPNQQQNQPTQQPINIGQTMVQQPAPLPLGTPGGLGRVHNTSSQVMYPQQDHQLDIAPTYVKPSTSKPRSRAIKIVDPDTQNEVKVSTQHEQEAPPKPLPPDPVVTTKTNSTINAAVAAEFKSKIHHLAGTDTPPDPGLGHSRIPGPVVAPPPPPPSSSSPPFIPGLPYRPNAIITNPPDHAVKSQEGVAPPLPEGNESLSMGDIPLPPKKAELVGDEGANVNLHGNGVVSLHGDVGVSTETDSKVIGDGEDTLLPNNVATSSAGGTKDVPVEATPTLTPPNTSSTTLENIPDDLASKTVDEIEHTVARTDGVPQLGDISEVEQESVVLDTNRPVTIETEPLDEDHTVPNKTPHEVDVKTEVTREPTPPPPSPPPPQDKVVVDTPSVENGEDSESQGTSNSTVDPVEITPTETKGPGAMPVSAKGLQTVPTETKGLQTASTQTKGPETTPTQTKGPETTPTQTKGPETTPTQTKGPETTPTQTKGPETTLTQTKGPEATPTQTKGPQTASTQTKGPETTSTQTKGSKNTPTPSKGPETTPTQTKVLGPKNNPIQSKGPETTPTQTKAPVKAKSIKQNDVNVKQGRGGVKGLLCMHDVGVAI